MSANGSASTTRDHSRASLSALWRRFTTGQLRLLRGYLTTEIEQRQRAVTETAMEVRG